MATKKPDNKSIDYYQAITAGIRNAARSRFIFRLTLTCLFLQPCDLLCLFQGLTFKQRKTANTDVYGLSQTPRVGLEPTTPRLTAACSTIDTVTYRKISLIVIFAVLFCYTGRFCFSRTASSHSKQQTERQKHCNPFYCLQFSFQSTTRFLHFKAA